MAQATYTVDVNVDEVIAEVTAAVAAPCPVCGHEGPRPRCDRYGGYRDGAFVVMCSAACADAVGGIRTKG